MTSVSPAISAARSTLPVDSTSPTSGRVPVLIAAPPSSTTHPATTSTSSTSSRITSPTKPAPSSTPVKFPAPAAPAPAASWKSGVPLGNNVITPEFEPLVRVLRRQSTTGNKRVKWVQLSESLTKEVYSRVDLLFESAGVGNLRQYVQRAATLGILRVVRQPMEKGVYIELRVSGMSQKWPTWRRRPTAKNGAPVWRR